MRSRNSVSQRAGLLGGDVLIGWIQGDASGSIRSPFDLDFAETERGPRGLVTLQGLRNNRARTRLLGSGKCGLRAALRLRAQVWRDITSVHIWRSEGNCREPQKSARKLR
jgi:hypothetical protein